MGAQESVINANDEQMICRSDESDVNSEPNNDEVITEPTNMDQDSLLTPSNIAHVSSIDSKETSNDNNFLHRQTSSDQDTTAAFFENLDISNIDAAGTSVDESQGSEEGGTKSSQEQTESEFVYKPTTNGEKYITDSETDLIDT
eukprot:164270-Ditylum_brightwellii.AAC.1